MLTREPITKTRGDDGDVGYAPMPTMLPTIVQEMAILRLHRRF